MKVRNKKKISLKKNTRAFLKKLAAKSSLDAFSKEPLAFFLFVLSLDARGSLLNASKS